MKTTFKYLLFMLMAFVMVSCDDDNSKKNENGSATQKLYNDLSGTTWKLSDTNHESVPAYYELWKDCTLRFDAKDYAGDTTKRRFYLSNYTDDYGIWYVMLGKLTCMTPWDITGGEGPAQEFAGQFHDVFGAMTNMTVEFPDDKTMRLTDLAGTYWVYTRVKSGL